MSLFGGKPVLIEIKARVLWQVAQDPRDGHWFGVCPDLNVTAAGDNWAEFAECAQEAMAILFKDLYAHGQMDAFLQKHGWSTTLPVPAHGPARFTVPFAIEHRDRVRDLVTA